MSITLADPRPTDSQRLKNELEASNIVPKSYAPREKSPLLIDLTEPQTNWLIQFASERWTALYNELSTWRAKMAKWERMSEEDYSDRKGSINRNDANSIQDIFSDSNETLGMAAGFSDFHLAQVRDDIFGTRPWMAANPEGSDDSELADVLTKHANWKISYSNLEAALKDALAVSTWGGTSFVKSRWEREIDTFRKIQTIAVSTETGDPIIGPTGDFITRVEDLPPEIQQDGSLLEWKSVPIEQNVIVYNNASAACIDFRDIAFDPTASELDLSETEVFVRFRMGILDLLAAYNIDPTYANDLRNALVTSEEETRSHRGETSGGQKTPGVQEDASNPMVSLVEGFIKCDPKGSGKTSRLHLIFSPQLQILFAADYLANVTPGAIVPIFPVRCFKLPRRVFGMGYFEKYESANNAVDRNHNIVIHRNKYLAHVWTGVTRNGLVDEGESGNILLDPKKPLELKEGFKMADVVTFAMAPDSSATNTALLNEQLQMAQMRSGITSAAQGELKGVPSSDLATGIRDLQTRGAILLKNPIAQQIADVREAVEFAVHLIYANQDRDESFSWGEGREAKLLTIRAGDVQGLRANVSLTLTQAQSRDKFQAAQTAIGIANTYASLPETEKASQRILYVQAIANLGFHNAEDIIRQAVVDPAGIVALVPPEMQPSVMQALAAIGSPMPQQQVPEGQSAPVSGAPNP